VERDGVPLPHGAGGGAEVLVCFAGLPAADESSSCGGVGGRSAGTAPPHTSCPSAVQVSEDVVVDLTGDLLLLQHPLDGLARRQRRRRLLLLLGLHGLDIIYYINDIYMIHIVNPCGASWTHLLFVGALLLLLPDPLLLLCGAQPGRGRKTMMMKNTSKGEEDYDDEEHQ